MKAAHEPEAAKARVAAVVLAAGLSSRMGKNKLRLELGGQTVLRRAVATAAAAGLSPILVVLGHQADRARVALAGLGCTPVVNPDYARGLNSSLRAGFRALPEGVAGAVAMLADMPFVTAPMIAALVERWRASGAPLAISTYGGVLAPPMLYGSALFSELCELDGEGGGKQVVKRHRGQAVELAWPAAALTDLDVPADVERARAALEGTVA